MATIVERFEQVVRACFDSFTAQSGLYRGYIDDKEKVQEFEDNLLHIGLKFSTRTSSYNDKREKDISKSKSTRINKTETKNDHDEFSLKSNPTCLITYQQCLQQETGGFIELSVNSTPMENHESSQETLTRTDQQSHQQQETGASSDLSMNGATCTVSEKQETSQQTTANNVSDQRLLFHQERGISIPDTSIPFIIVGTISKHCMFGPHYWGQDSPGHTKHPEDTGGGNGRKQRCHLQPSRKKGCPSVFNVKCARYFPEFKVEDSPPQSKWKQRCTRQKSLNALRDALEKGVTPQSYDRYYIEISDISRHNHEFETASDLTPKIHPKLATKIQSLVAEGFTTLQEIKTRLTEYTNADILNGREPSKSNKAFYPSELTIRNRIKKALIQHIQQQECTLEEAAENCRSVVDELKDMTYGCTDHKALEEVSDRLRQCSKILKFGLLPEEVVNPQDSIQDDENANSSLAQKRQVIDGHAFDDLPPAKKPRTPTNSSSLGNVVL